jgi:hypothetical protein
MVPLSIPLIIAVSAIFGIIIRLYTTPTVEAIYIALLIWIPCIFIGIGLLTLIRILKPRDYFKTKKGEYREDRVREHLYSYRILYIVLPVLVTLLIISLVDSLLLIVYSERISIYKDHFTHYNYRCCSYSLWLWHF